MLTTILLIMSLVCICILTVIIIILYRMIRHMMMIMQQQSQVLYFIDKQHRVSDEKIQDMETNIETISTSIANVLDVYKQSVTKRIHPRPELVEQINATIMDLLTIEVGLSRNMSAPKRDSVPKIIQSVIETYPEVDQEYLTKKTLSMIETYSET